jgi:hypothetical protein
MHRTAAPPRSGEVALLVVALVPLGWLGVLAASPSVADRLPSWLAWFGRPGSAAPIAIVVTMIVVLCVMSFRSEKARRARNVPVEVVAGLAATSAVLGLCSYWNCHDATHPFIIQPLIWTVSLVKGGVSDFSLAGRTCPNPVPDALWVARLTALGAIFTGLAGVVITLFRSQVDRLRANHAQSVTAVIGIDDETRSMISAIATTLDPASTLVVVTSGPNEPGAMEARNQGGRVVTVDFNDPDSLTSLRLWRRLQRLYLMSPDPPTNEQRLEAITRVLSSVGHRQRLPLTVRIDDPWQAEAWRAGQLGKTDTRWAADAVGKYEVTARWLLDNIIAAQTIKHVFVCGASELTLALCADLSRRKREFDYCSEPEATELPAITLVSDEAEEYQKDHEFHHEQVAFASTGPGVQAEAHIPSVSVLMRLIGESDGSSNAAIFVDDKARGPSHARSTGTRLAARFPTMPIYIWDMGAQMAIDPVPIVGRLRTYRLALDVPEGHAQDVWERAAKLIHGRYVASVGPQPEPSPARLPWDQLDEFYRESNRRQVRNALWMVEGLAEHTWNTWGNPPKPLSVHDMAGLTALQQLARMGFDTDSAMNMAKAEHLDWCDYYTRNRWKYGPERNDERRIHDRIVAWPAKDYDKLDAREKDIVDRAVTSLAATLWSLRQLGYRSRPVWRSVTRVGTVTAQQRNTPWTWTSRSGHTMRANAGDWRVQSDGRAWSVRDDIFRKSYEHVDGDQWRRCGKVSARLAHPGETIVSLEGPETAGEGDWVVRGVNGEQWPISAQDFAERYREVDPAANETAVPKPD